MVWFQCEDCGENLKKPKLPNHFRMCSAGKLSCIDCGEMFSQETVQGHTQCITEAEKYGPKGEGKPSHGTQLKPEKPKKNADVDIHVGLSSRPPWFCSLCNAQATSRQTLMGHADGKKHRAKARAHHASQNQTSQADEQTQNRDSASEATNKANVSNDPNGVMSDNKISTKDSSSPVETENGSIATKKRKIDAPTDGDGVKGEDAHAEFITNGEVIQTDPSTGSHKSSKRSKSVVGVVQDGHAVDKQVHTEENLKKKIKWKKLVTSALKSNSDGALKLKKLKKLVIQSLKESGVTGDEDKLLVKLLAKVSSSSRFVVDGKHIRLAATEASF